MMNLFKRKNSPTIFTKMEKIMTLGWSKEEMIVLKRMIAHLKFYKMLIPKEVETDISELFDIMIAHRQEYMLKNGMLVR
jgi:hypothetical protein